MSTKLIQSLSQGVPGALTEVTLGRTMKKRASDVLVEPNPTPASPTEAIASMAHASQPLDRGSGDCFAKAWWRPSAIARLCESQSTGVRPSRRTAAAA